MLVQPEFKITDGFLEARRTNNVYVKGTSSAEAENAEPSPELAFDNLQVDRHGSKSSQASMERNFENNLSHQDTNYDNHANERHYARQQSSAVAYPAVVC